MIAIILIAADQFILFQFSPMRIDHHGWQIVLGLGLMANVLAGPSFRNGLIGGVTAAILLAISLEGLPIVAMVAAMTAIEWVWNHDRAIERRLMGYLAALTAGGVVLQFVTRGPGGFVASWCDSLSVAYLAAFATAATVFCALCYTALRHTFAGRAMLLGATAIAAAGALVMIAPMCASGPFAALDPIVVDHWYAHVSEGQPIWAGGRVEASHSLIPSLIGLAGMWIGWRQASDVQHRRRWALLGAAGLGAVIVSILVLRAGSTAHVIVMPGCAVVAVCLWRWSRSRTAAVARVAAALATVVAVPNVAGATSSWAMARLSPDGEPNGQSTIDRGAHRATVCMTDADAERLDRLGPTTMLTPLDLGPIIVRKTRHSVVATGHHRNNAAMAGAITTFVSPARQARATMRRLGATTVAICLGANDLDNYAASSGQSFARDLVAERAPDWLEPVAMAPASRLRVWRMLPMASVPVRSNIDSAPRSHQRRDGAGLEEKQ